MRPTRRHISTGWSTTAALVLSSSTVRKTSITRQTRWIPFINGPSFARDISRCSVVTCALLPAAHIHIWQSYKWENDNIYCVCLCRRPMGVCCTVRLSVTFDLLGCRTKLAPEENQIGGKITIIRMLPPIRSEGTHRAHATRPSEKLQCLHTPSARLSHSFGRLVSLWSCTALARGSSYYDQSWRIEAIQSEYLPTRIFVVLLLFIFCRESRYYYNTRNTSMNHINIINCYP